jgi:hypothetical protein
MPETLILDEANTTTRHNYKTAPMFNAAQLYSVRYRISLMSECIFNYTRSSLNHTSPV